MSLQVGIPLFVIAALLQSTILPHLRVFGGQPDLIVILALAWASLDDDQEGMAWAFVGGFFLDLLSGVPLGVSSLVLVPIAYFVGLAEAQLYRNNLLLLTVLGMGSALAYHLGYLLLLRFLVDYPVAWPGALWYVTLPSVALDTILIFPAVRLLQRWYNRLHPRRVTF